MSDESARNSKRARTEESELGDEGVVGVSSEQRFRLPPGRFPMRKALNEMRSRWGNVEETRDGRATELAECSFASTPLVTHGAWRGHTFASAAMFYYCRNTINPYLEDMSQILNSCAQQRLRARGRKSKRTSQLVSTIKRIKAMEQSGVAVPLTEEWSRMLHSFPL